MTNSTHVFQNHCVSFEEILAESTLDRMLKVVYKQSQTELARMRVDFLNYKDYGVDEWCPAYFGMFVEWLAQHFLNHYGHLFNVHGVNMYDSVGSMVSDYGIDGEGVSIRRSKLRSTNRAVDPNSPVFIQVKGTMNPRKEYSPNDGNRLPNFGCNAFATAIRSGYAYQARYILFTTGKGLHFTMDEMYRNMVEVISRKQIKALMDDDTVFLNRLRASVGLAEVQLKRSKQDHEARLIQREFDKEIA